ncbi:DNA-binding response OmpR family regulator [Azospirillum agricola]|uniref:response regulator n=1 Tax=Azospirillum agricola TaxID=1720247 RepID=UPI001AE8C75E|nr:response regulator [Azospirillum agricola]MBP2231032.1 DNA-binding response OmpR family regulator [Azospirillum agricola]
MRILLVEDEVLIAMEQRLYLEAAGHEVLGPAVTAAEAVAMAAEDPPDLALVDVHLARNSSGIDAAQVLTRQGVPCLFITSFRDEMRQAGIPIPGIGCLPKPFSEHSLLGAVEVARTILTGGTPRDVPKTMELFDN